MVFPLLVFPSLNPGAVRAMVRGNVLPWCSWTEWPLFWGSLVCVETAKAEMSKKPRVYQLSRAKALPLLHLKSRRPRGAFPQKTSLSTSSEHLPPLEKHSCFVPKLYHYSLNPRAETKSRMFKPLRCIFKWIYWTKRKTSLKCGDAMVPDGSKFTALPPVSYLLSFSNNTLAAWQLSRAV